MHFFDSLFASRGLLEKPSHARDPSAQQQQERRGSKLAQPRKTRRLIVTALVLLTLYTAASAASDDSDLDELRAAIDRDLAKAGLLDVFDDALAASDDDYDYEKAYNELPSIVADLPPAFFEADARDAELAAKAAKGAVEASGPVRFPTRNDNYSASWARTMAVYAVSSYCSADAIGSSRCPCTRLLPSKFVIKTFRNPSHRVQAYLAVDKGNKKIIISFRGSDNIRNWISNLDFAMADSWFVRNAGKVHGGFLAAYNSFRSAILISYRRTRAQFRDYHVVATGHSFGGSLASLLSADLVANEKEKNLGLWTFGAPRVGDTGFADWMNTRSELKESFRIVWKNDPVPKVPFMSWGYHHAGRELWHKRGAQNNFVECRAPEHGACSVSVSFAAGMLSFRDHSWYLEQKSDCSDDRRLLDDGR